MYHTYQPELTKTKVRNTGVIVLTMNSGQNSKKKAQKSKMSDNEKYEMQKKKGRERQRKFRERMSDEKREAKKQYDKGRQARLRATKVVKSVCDMTPKEHRQMKNYWRERNKSGTSKIKFKYSEEAMALAMAAVGSGMSINRASNEYSVPRSTLFRYISLGKSSGHRKMGPQPVFGDSVELYLTDWVRRAASGGFPVTRDSLQDSAQQIALEARLCTPFPGGRPGRRWTELFLRRHPELVPLLRKRKKAQMTPCIDRVGVDTWCDSLDSYIQQENLHEALREPRRVFNAHHLTFNLCPESHDVTSVASEPIDSSDPGQYLTVVGCVGADGTMVPPMVVYPNARPFNAPGDEWPDNWSVGKTSDGRLTAEQLTNYFESFHRWLEAVRMDRPVVVFLDASAPIIYRLTRFCTEHSIFPIALHSEADHPIELSVFRPLSECWNRLAPKWGKKGLSLSRNRFALALKIFLHVTASPAATAGGFRRVGLVPLDRTAQYCCPDVSEPCLTFGDLAAIERRVEEFLTKMSSERAHAREFKLEVPESEQERAHSALNCLEPYIDPETLESFRNCFSNETAWTGRESAKDLYEVWRKISDQSNNPPSERSQSEGELKSELCFSECDAEIIKSEFVQREEDLFVTSEEREYVISVIF